MLQLLVLAAETAEEGPPINEWVVGGISLLLLLGLLGGLMAFGAGREHS